MATIPYMSERDLPFFIVNQLARDTDLSLSYQDLEQPVGHARIDGVLDLSQQSSLWVEVKRSLRKSQLPEVLGQIQHLQQLASASGDRKDFVLMTSYLSKPQRAYLRAGGVYYADLAGNAYLKLNGNLIWIEGKGKTDLPTIQQDAPFTPTAMRLIFAYLLQPELVEQTYRMQAEQSGVAKSTIGDQIRKLVDAGYLASAGSKHHWVNLSQLAKDWLQAYPKVLKPTLYLLRVKFAKKEHYQRWQEIWEGNLELQWGGEAGGALLTSMLRPGKLTLYSRMPAKEVMKTLRVIPDPEGPLDILQAFWPKKLASGSHHQHVPPLLIFADLMQSQDLRNLQIARIIHEQYFKDLFEAPELEQLPKAI